jgi:hypothetical protein
MKHIESTFANKHPYFPASSASQYPMNYSLALLDLATIPLDLLPALTLLMEATQITPYLLHPTMEQILILLPHILYLLATEIIQSQIQHKRRPDLYLSSNVLV